MSRDTKEVNLTIEETNVLTDYIASLHNLKKQLLQNKENMEKQVKEAKEKIDNSMNETNKTIDVLNKLLKMAS